jgi:hypothetical protein
MNKFKEIFEKHDTDKAINYSEAYESIITPIRNDINLVFEIGVNRGGSIRGFKEYFQNAMIVGIDIDPSCFFEDNRTKVEIGNATEDVFIYGLLNKYGHPDIVIDDGSHFSSDIRKAYCLLYPYTEKYYIIEDYGTQFPQFRDGFYINDNIPATSIIHNKVDDLLCSKHACKSIHIYHSIGIIVK